MTKLEYSDFYKFLSSLGIVLISLALLIPWLFLREPFDALISTADLSSLTPTAQSIIITRQNTALWFLQNLVWISIVLTIAGLGFLISGIFLWAGKQRTVDTKDELETEKLKHEIASMTSSQFTEKVIKEAEEELQATTKTELPVKSISSVASDYLHTESTIVDKLTACFGAGSILPNVQIKGKGYDVILLSEGNQDDVIFEIKVARSGFETDRVESAIVNLRNATKAYTNTAGKNAKGIVLFLSPDFQSDELVAKYYEVVSETARKLAGDIVKPHFLTKEKLMDLSNDELRKMIYE